MNIFRKFFDLSDRELDSLKIYENAVASKRVLNFKAGVFSITSENLKEELLKFEQDEKR